MSIKVVHYINQYFAGKGGEDKTDHPLEVINAPVGPGQLLQRELRDGTIVLTLVCGDGYFGTHEKEVLEEVRIIIQRMAPDVVVTGPAFGSGRYGLACGAVADCVMNDCGVPAIAGMSHDNPAVEIYHTQAYIVPSGESVREMANALQRIAKLAIRLGKHQPIGTPEEEGYIPRGVRKNIRLHRSAETRALEALLQKLCGEKLATELKFDAGKAVLPPPQISDLSKATIAVVTECGIVPKGNPDRIEGVRTKKWAKYSLNGLRELSPETHESIHGGYDNSMINLDPNRGIPLDALRMLEDGGFFHKLHDTYYVTCGNWGDVNVMRQIGRTIATELKQAGINGVLVPAT
ncbi:MAG: glycine/betaine/sarcosine/D-proline family reductase selenoprotein B [Nitrospirota bacterium]